MTPRAPTLLEIFALTQRAHRAMKAANQLLAAAPAGTQIECRHLAELLQPIEETLWSALDELAPITGGERPQ